MPTKAGVPGPLPTAIPNVYLSIDRRIPRSRGGSSDRSNLQALCTRCNSAKGTRLEVAA
jgi:5-methylcytosine-specific restriction endonuclease McrA